MTIFLVQKSSTTNDDDVIIINHALTYLSFDPICSRFSSKKEVEERRGAKVPRHRNSDRANQRALIGRKKRPAQQVIFTGFSSGEQVKIGKTHVRV